MVWEQAPKEPRLGAPVLYGLQILMMGLTLVTHHEWWMWAVALTLIVVGAFELARWFRDDRRYRAWVEWDEAGGPDADTRRDLHG